MTAEREKERERRKKGLNDGVMMEDPALHNCPFLTPGLFAEVKKEQAQNGWEPCPREESWAPTQGDTLGLNGKPPE